MPLVRYSLFLVFLTTMGCQPAEVRQSGLQVGEGRKVVPVVDGSHKIPLISGQYETSANEQFVIPFKASKLLKAPQLSLSFIVKSRGHCRHTYENTDIMLNNILLESLDFREYEDEQAVNLNIELPLSRIKTGENRILISMGSCDYDIDSLQLNQTSLVF